MHKPLRSTLFPYTTLFRSSNTLFFNELMDAKKDILITICARGGSKGVPGKNIRNINGRSEEHTSELQSRENLVCRLLLERKKDTNCTFFNGELCVKIRRAH